MTTHPLILQLDTAGNPRSWITYENAAYYYAKNLIAWTVDGDEYTIRGGKNRITSEQSKMELSTIIAVKGASNSRHAYQTPTLTNRALFRRDQHICAYCGNEFFQEKLTRDHIMPSSRGGKDCWTNVVTSCGGCNKKKDNKTPEEANMKLLYVPYAPSKSEHLILMNRNILANQMDFLLARVGQNSRLLEKDFKQTILNKRKFN